MSKFEIDALWQLEETFWLQGEKAFAEHMADGCMMVFPEPVGLMVGNAIIDSLAGAPRWLSVQMRDRVIRQFVGDSVCLAYRARGERGGNTGPYHALCASTYVLIDGKWRLAMHQHTPV
ncbi:nuclear transport factor 2 family protein [Roseibium salinum]|uniref:Nuclear transport factor 2 family protein n=1 Tax=Roseibium salinum TaxID=1604349 RepID=A0ABT3QWV3_9HYPH|nr:nuclear transport factor 2 family protein [Roseibium sp. DSM 29163]MCX2721407.1 nuclear transport factor 2 family protein [Roseibium sp. DSM 29163]